MRKQVGGQSFCSQFSFLSTSFLSFVTRYSSGGGLLCIKVLAFLVVFLFSLFCFSNNASAGHGTGWSIVFSKHNLAGGVLIPKITTGDEGLPISKLEEEMEDAGTGYDPGSVTGGGGTIYSSRRSRWACLSCHASAQIHEAGTWTDWGIAGGFFDQCRSCHAVVGGDPPGWGSGLNTGDPPGDASFEYHMSISGPLVMQRVCVFCHTPHGANTTTITISASGTAGGGALDDDLNLGSGGLSAGGIYLATERPLWNRVLSTATYSMYMSPTMDQTPPSAPVGVSRACLSCHDGTVAFDAIRNWPGSGEKAKSDSDPDCSRGQIGGAGGCSDPPASGFWWVGISNLGQNLSEGVKKETITTPDLTDDHPVSIMYGAAGDDEKFWWDGDTRPDYSTLDLAGNAATSGTLATDVDLYGATGSGATPVGGTYDFSTLTSYARIWFNEGGPTTRVIADDNEILLYNGKVECASCHNVHGTDDGTGHPYATFLRKSNRGSNVCLTCHIK